MKLRSLFQRSTTCTKKNWQDCFAHEARFQHGIFYLMIISTHNTCSPLLYEVKEKYFSHSNLLDAQLFETYRGFLTTLTEKGIHCYQIEKGKCLSHEILQNKHPELYDTDICEIILYQTYGLEPANAHRKDILKQHLKKSDNLQQSLVYQCYINDTARILEAVKKATKKQLNQKLEYVGTPLGICAQNDNFEAFQAIAEKGADLNKQSLSNTPLALAFTHSPAIVHYIYEHYPT